MFVRRKTNASGTISVYVVDKSHGRYEVLKSFGTARSAREADILENKARLFIREQTGQVRDLFARPADEVMAGLDGAKVQVAGPELIFGELYNRLGFKGIGDDHFRHLVMSRILHPGSALRAVEYLGQYFGIKADPARLYASLDGLCFPGSETVRAALSRAVRGHGPQARLFLLPMPFGKAESHPKVRQDKHVRVPVLYLGILASPDGRPLSYGLWSARLFEARRFRPELEALAKRWRLSGLQVVAAEGLLPPARRRDLEDHPVLSLCADEALVRELVRFEETFRMNRFDLQVRPRRHRIRFRIEGHVVMCFCALSVSQEMERILLASGTGLTLDEVRGTVLSMRRLTYQSPSTGRTRSVLFQLDPAQQQVYDLIY